MKNTRLVVLVIAASLQINEKCRLLLRPTKSKSLGTIYLLYDEEVFFVFFTVCHYRLQLLSSLIPLYIVTAVYS